ncbi:MAG TPA: anthranilate phosphoribosyltransferase [Nitrolancea sp.]|jgi:anthranilate phosphoribosyltransferase|nr:anthranilate phosphoribosyltransferase [Nitrolancea sp.]
MTVATVDSIEVSANGQDVVREAIRLVIDGGSLNRAEATAAMDSVMSGGATSAQIGSLMTALRMRGETDDEIAGFAESMRRHALPVRPKQQDLIVDTCGTGGDGANTFNISTAAAFVVAGSGIRVAKHGNRAMSSQCGSADVLEGLGVRIDLGPQSVAECIDEVGIGFMFAAVFHPAMRFAGPARREIGIRTVFNILGPLTNPAGAKHQVVGVANREVAQKVARVLAMLGTTHAVVVCSNDGLDELSISAENSVFDVSANGSVLLRSHRLNAEEVGLEPAPLETVRGGSVVENAQRIRDILDGEPGPARSITLLNAGAALYAADAVTSIRDGVKMAAESVDSGAACGKLNALISLTQQLGEA